MLTVTLDGAASLVMTFYSMYTISLIRLNHAFHESVHEIRPCESFIHAINITISVMALVLSEILDAVAEFNFSFYKKFITMCPIRLLHESNHDLFLFALSQRQTIVNEQTTESIKLNRRQIS